MKSKKYTDEVIQVVEKMDALSDASPAKGKRPKSSKPTAYVCVDLVCAPPVPNAKALKETLIEWCEAKSRDRSRHVNRRLTTSGV